MGLDDIKFDVQNACGCETWPRFEPGVDFNVMFAAARIESLRADLRREEGLGGAA